MKYRFTLSRRLVVIRRYQVWWIIIISILYIPFLLQYCLIYQYLPFLLLLQFFHLVLHFLFPLLILLLFLRLLLLYLVLLLSLLLLQGFHYFHSFHFHRLVLHLRHCFRNYLLVHTLLFFTWFLHKHRQNHRNFHIPPNSLGPCGYGIYQSL
jgi:hypothetical protein